MLAVLVTGSRKHTGVDLIWSELQRCSPDLVIHGAASGADELARQWCEGKCVNQIQMPAPWYKHGRKAGPYRNTKMLSVLQALRDCGWDCMVLAFPLSDSIGTKHMMRIAKAAEFDVVALTGSGGKP